jgi:hypothetical protein
VASALARAVTSGKKEFHASAVYFQVVASALARAACSSKNTFHEFLLQVVASALARAATSGKKEFHVYLTKSGECTKRLLEAASIRTTLIEDLAIGYIMNKVHSDIGYLYCTELSMITIYFFLTERSR